VLGTAGTAGSLTAGQWDFGDNDTLGFSTIYVRLSDGTDPDSKSTDYVQLLDRIRAGDYVRLPAGSGSMSSNLDVSATTINAFFVEEGYSGEFGSSTADLKITLTNTTGVFSFFGSGQAYIDIGASQVAPEVRGTARGSSGIRGLEIKGTGISTFTVENGSVGIAARHGRKSTVTTLRVLNGTTTIGAGTTLTTLQQNGGNVIQNCSATTVTVYAGVHRTEEAAAITTLNVEGGTSVLQSTGTVTTANLNGGTLDVRQGTVSTLNHARASATYQKSQAATVTTYVPPAGPMKLTASPM
jgi:hypothetical protein